ncbi:MAG: hypothetical protein INR73_16620 [Williamsia sp.]|nr:hypothetical protein [Williamsia sp.]
MGIGRREFVRLTSLGLTGLAIDPLQAVVIHDHVYINRKLGILFHKPADWVFIATKDFGKLGSEQIIGEGLEQSPEEIREELGYPICVATKYDQDNPLYKGIFSPTITLNVTPKEELAYLGVESFEELIGMSEYGTSQLLKGFKVVRRYEPYLISNCTFYEFDAEYIFEHIEMERPVKVELKVFKAANKGFYYDFNCHQSKEQNQHADKEFEEFKTTIKLI